MGLNFQRQMFEEEPHKAISFDASWDYLSPDLENSIPDLIIGNDQLIQKNATLDALLPIKKRYTNLFCIFHQGKENDAQEKNRRSEWQKIVKNFWGTPANFFETEVHNNNEDVLSAINLIKEGKSRKVLKTYNEGLQQIKNLFTKNETELNQKLQLLHTAHSAQKLNAFLHAQKPDFLSHFSISREDLAPFKKCLAELQKPHLALKDRLLIIKELHQILFSQ